MTDSKSKDVIAIFFLILLVSAGFTYYRTMVTRDYIVENSAEESL
jgi:hypothetical protein